jgi:hypothetical protein
MAEGVFRLILLPIFKSVLEDPELRVHLLFSTAGAVKRCSSGAKLIINIWKKRLFSSQGHRRPREISFPRTYVLQVRLYANFY